MKHRRTRDIMRAIALTMCSASLLCTTSVLAAADQVSSTDFGYYATSQQTRNVRYTGITTFESELEISGNGYASCSTIVRALLGYSCDVTLELQQKSGNSWKSVKEWTSSGRTNSINEGCYVTSGHDYRLKLSADVYAGGKLVESQTEYSTAVHY